MTLTLDALRCSYCPAELGPFSNYNEAYWEAQREGWWVSGNPGEPSVCPEHNGASEGRIPDSLRWEIDCDICEMTEEFDNETEARREALTHDCSDWLDDPRVIVSSPKERAENRAAAAIARERAEHQRMVQKQDEAAVDERLHTTFQEITRFYEDEQRKRKRFPRLFKLIDFLDRTMDTR